MVKLSFDTPGFPSPFGKRVRVRVRGGIKV